MTALFDSILRGYPIGALLLWRRSTTPEGPVRFGPVEVAAPDSSDVRWLVDGQQRVTTLVAALTPRAFGDPTFDVWFDPDEGRFHPTRRDGPDTRWVHVSRLLDAADLGEFLHEWPPGRNDRDRRRALLDAGKRLREYPVPAYVIETDDDAALREIFKRTNRQGKSLQETDIFDALVVGASRDESLESMAGSLLDLGWGEIDEKTLLRAIIGNLGRDPTRRIDAQSSDAFTEQDHLRAGVASIRTPLAATIALLRDDAGIGHRNLLPYYVPLVVLPSFFARVPRPDGITRRLLVRWVWRGFSSLAHERQGPLRQALSAARRDDSEPEARVRQMIATLPDAPPAPWSANIPFRGDSAQVRIGLLALSTLEPMDLAHPEVPVNLADCFGAERSLSRVFGSAVAPDDRWHETIANWLLQPRAGGLAKRRLRVLAADSSQVDVLRSHAVDPMAAAALANGEDARFLALRAAALERVVADRIAVYASWDEPERPNLRRLLEPTG